MLKRFNAFNRFSDPVLRHFAWDFTDFVVFAMWTCIYGMHVHEDDHDSFFLICVICLVPATILLYVGGRNLFFPYYNTFQRFLFIGYFLIVPWIGVVDLMLFRGDMTGEQLFYCGLYQQYNLMENPVLNFGRNLTKNCHALAKHSNSSGHDVMKAMENMSSIDDYKNAFRGIRAQYEANFSAEFRVMAMIALIWYMGLIGLSNPRMRAPSSAGDVQDAGGCGDATKQPLLSAHDAGEGVARTSSKKPMNPVLAQHLLNELLYDCFALSIQVWLMTEIRMKDNYFPYKVFIDFLNLSTTFIDLVMVKGPNFILHILKTGGSPEKILELMLQTAEELEQQAQKPEDTKKAESDNGAQDVECPPMLEPSTAPTAEQP